MIFLVSRMSINVDAITWRTILTYVAKWQLPHFIRQKIKMYLIVYCVYQKHLQKVGISENKNKYRNISIVLFLFTIAFQTLSNIPNPIMKIQTYFTLLIGYNI